MCVCIRVLTEVVTLSNEQRDLYDRCAGLWLYIGQTLRSLSSRGLCADNYAGPCTSAQTKFFAQLTLSFKVGEIQRQTRRALNSGKCVVIGLQSTGDSAGKAAAARSDAVDFDCLFSATREAVDGLLHTLGKAQAAHNAGWRSFCADVAGRLGALNLPPSALDELIDYFGSSNVAGERILSLRHLTLTCNLTLTFALTLTPTSPHSHPPPPTPPPPPPPHATTTATAITPATANPTQFHPIPSLSILSHPTQR